jgi:catechol 2,3-dioxygenase-like lactoylglutathione lyase family enzyme
VLTDCRIHATIPAADLGRARKWYADKLGFEPVRQLPGGLMYDSAEGTRFIIYPTPNAGRSPNTLMGFATDDIEAEVSHLKARGVVFEEYDFPTLQTVDSIATVGETRSAWFHDSEGNIIGVVQLPPEVVQLPPE